MTTTTIPEDLFALLDQPMTKEALARFEEERAEMARINAEIERKFLDNFAKKMRQDRANYISAAGPVRGYNARGEKV